MVLPNGYIMDSFGPCGGDGSNNDHRILRRMLSESEFRKFFRPNDTLVLDRGFRDSIEDLNLLEYKTFMPNLLSKGQKQFTATEANESRRVNIFLTSK